MKKSLWVTIVGLLILLSFFGTSLGQKKPPKKTPELLSQGKKLYEQNCVPCHGEKGDGRGALSSPLKPAPSDFAEPLNKWPNTKGDPRKIFDVISKGIPNSAMVKWDHLSEQERWALVYTVLEFATPAKATPAKKKK